MGFNLLAWFSLGCRLLWALIGYWRGLLRLCDRWVEGWLLGLRLVGIFFCLEDLMLVVCEFDCVHFAMLSFIVTFGCGVVNWICFGVDFMVVGFSEVLLY